MLWCRNILWIVLLSVFAGMLMAPTTSQYARFLMMIAVIGLVHEAGHFVVALYSGVAVQSANLFWGPVVAKWTRGGTSYCIRAIPFGIGGFVNVKAMQFEPEPDSVEAQSLLKQFALFAAGSVANVVIAFASVALFACLIGEPQEVAPTVQNVSVNSSGYHAGIQNGDVITAFNGGRIENIDQFQGQSLFSTGSNHEVTVLREGEEICLQLEGVPRLGIGVCLQEPPAVRLSLLQALHSSVDFLSSNLTAICEFFRGFGDHAAEVVGPVGVASVAPVIDYGGLSGWIKLFATMSYQLAVVNLFPIPGLDGGHILFLVLRKLRLEPSLRVRKYLTIGGVLALMGLMGLVLARDLLAILRPT